MRADAATREVVDALADLGVVWSFLGVESLKPDNLSALGRGARADANTVAMKNLTRRGVLFHFNLLLLHPGSTIDGIAGEKKKNGECVGINRKNVGPPYRFCDGFPGFRFRKVGSAAQSNWDNVRFVKDEERKEWGALLDRATVLRSELLHFMRFAYRDDVELLERIGRCVRGQ